MNQLVQLGIVLGIVALCVVGLGFALTRRNRRHGSCSCKGLSGEKSSCACSSPES
ncbi:MAG TPA: hypothetical protein P5567_01280 [Kiritimatiellia bacterium]|nr:hypothetical protein [Kiritimatiellia bacterium]HRZ11067.1 hypothetical protein [Kiritimatiellia bacterium]HSA18640.1 hypothetical protein [Kiritimatiellia bacterium]